MTMVTPKRAKKSRCGPYSRRAADIVRRSSGHFRYSAFLPFQWSSRLQWAQSTCSLLGWDMLTVLHLASRHCPRQTKPVHLVMAQCFVKWATTGTGTNSQHCKRHCQHCTIVELNAKISNWTEIWHPSHSWCEVFVDFSCLRSDLTCVATFYPKLDRFCCSALSQALLRAAWPSKMNCHKLE